MQSYETNVAPGSEYFVYTPSALARETFFYPVCTGRFFYEPGYCLKRNSYDSFLVMLITSGQCVVTYQGQTFPASAGNVVFLDCYQPHQYESDTGWQALWIHFDGPMSRKYYEAVTGSFGNVMTPPDLPAVEHTLTRICNIFRDNATIIEAKLSSYITSILTELFLCSRKKETEALTHQSLSETISYINEHFAEPLTLEDLAERAALSPFYFSRKFSQATGMTPHQYILATRINAARFLLKTSALSVKEIAFHCGFTSESSFCTTFRKWEHISPGAYRDAE